MTDKVGTKTGKQTQAGRDVYVTPEGENVSEKSTTFKYKGKWINVPSIHNGRRYDDDTLKIMLEAEIIEPTSSHENREDAEKAAKARSDNLKFNKGGTPMKDQMELFEDGGLKDEGGMVDEESGNKVPVGGTRKGVRDDVPAMVSEGEFVFPEDVTRYIGLDKLMQMRQSAKMGLKRMEAMGQMGNSDEATMPDDMPFGVADLVIVSDDTGEELEMQEGGFVTSTSSYRTAPQQPVYATPPTSPTAPSATVSTTRRLTPELERPAKSSIDFKKLMGEASIEYVEYRNEAGNNMMIPHIGGVPMFPIPEGYTRYEASNEDSVENSDTEEAEVVKETNKISKDRPDRDIAAEIQAEFDKAPPPINWGTLDTDELISQTDGITGMASNIATAGMFLLGPLAPLGLAAINQQNRDALAAITARIAEGNLSPEDLAKLTEQQALLEKKLGTVGSSIISNIVDGISTALGLSETITETAKAKVAESTSGVSASEIPEAPPEQVQTDRGFTPTNIALPAATPTEVTPKGIETDRGFTPTNIALPAATADRVSVDPRGKDQIPTVEQKQSSLAPPVTGGYDEQPTVQGTTLQGMEEAPIVYGESSPTAAKVEVTPYEGSVQQTAANNAVEQMRRMTEERQQQRLQVIDPEFTAGLTAKPYSDPMYQEAGRGYTPPPSMSYDEGPVTYTPPPTVEQQMGTAIPSYDEAGLNVDPRRQQGPKQAEVFQTQEAERMEIERQQTLADTQKRLEENKELFADAEKRLAEQLVVSASDIKNANDAAEARYNNDIAAIRSEHTKRIDDLMKIGILDRAAAERKALELAKAEEEAAKRKMEEERKRIADAKAKSDAEAKRREEEEERYKASLAATGTATRTGSAAPLTSLRPPARPTAPAIPSTPEASNNKSTRLDSSNPNTNKNIDAHLSSTEKASLAANPSLAAHYTATANRRANEAASGDTSNTDSANEAADSSGGDCCFIMLEARYGNGTMDMVVRKYRDEYMTDRNRRGYYKVAEVFVPLMRKYPVFKWFITKIFADPLVSYGKYHYNEKKIGVIFTPVKNFWMKLFDVVGGNTKFIRENGETI